MSAILTGFFGGMAIGATLGGRIADRVRSPLRMYGLLELALVVVVLVTPLTFGLINEVYRGIYPALEGTPLLAIARLILAVLALAPATIMMGATFPALVRHFTRTARARPGVRATVLGQHHGRGRRHAARGARPHRAARAERRPAGRGALLRDRRPRRALAGRGDTGAVAVSEAASNRHATALRPRLPRASTAARRIVWLPLVIAFVSGLTSLGYQVTWTRLLTSGTGGLTYVFTVILALFLIGHRARRDDVQRVPAADQGPDPRPGVLAGRRGDPQRGRADPRDLPTALARRRQSDGVDRRALIGAADPDRPAGHVRDGFRLPDGVGAAARRALVMAGPSPGCCSG